MISVRAATRDDKERLWTMLQDYLDELSSFRDINKTYPYFDRYWDENERFPYLIESDGAPAGFALVNRNSPFGRNLDHYLAEFSILPAFRGKGIGRRAAHDILNRHKGLWEISHFQNNLPAAAFWDDVMKEKPHQVVLHQHVRILSFFVA